MTKFEGQKFKPNGDPVDVMVPGLYVGQEVGAPWVVYRKYKSYIPGERYEHLFKGTWKECQDFLSNYDKEGRR